MTDRPEELEFVNHYVGAAELAHLYAFRVHRKLVELDAGGDHAQKLLAESAAVVLQDIPALVGDWRALEREWFEVELLDPANLDRVTHALEVRFAELGPALKTLLLRQDQIVAKLVNLLENARRT
jgi:hypothetical protein